MAMVEQVDATDVSSKYLTFQLVDQEYGVEIMKVQEIIEMMGVRRVPSAPPHIRGIINLNGKVIPVVDLRTKFGIPTQEDTSRTSIILVHVAGPNGSMIMGIVADDVCEVVELAPHEVEQPFTFASTIDNEFITGMGKIGHRVLFLLDIDKMLSPEEMSQVKQVVK